MFKKTGHIFKNFDWLILASALLLALFGLAENYSIALGQASIDLLNFKKQVVFVVVGLFLFFGLALIDYRFWRNSRFYLYILSVISLLAVLLAGRVINGTRGWFLIFGFGIQPVEIAKIFLLIFLSGYFSSFAVRFRGWKQLIFSFLWCLPILILVVLQPDFGSAVLLTAVWGVLLLVSGFPKKYFAFLAIVALLAFSFSWFFLFKDYQKDRLLTFAQVDSSVQKSSYNVRQAIIAVGGGGMHGRGLGFGSQSQLKFLPEASTDFIFAVVAEEMGFLGVSLVLLFFAILLFRLVLSASRLDNDFSIFFVLGAGGLIFIEMFINIGMNMGLLPVVGIALPFLSYGGSSVISNFFLLGIVESVIMRSKNNY